MPVTEWVFSRVSRKPRQKRESVLSLWLLGWLTICAWALPLSAEAASFSAKDLQVLGRVVGFMLPPPSADAIVAIAYTPGNAASRQDAESIAALLGGELRTGKAMLRVRLMEANALGAGGFAVVIAAAGANGPQLGASARAARALCVTTDIEAVRAGFCTMAITSEPRIDIVVNHAVSAATGIGFAAAFRMMIREL